MSTLPTGTVTFLFTDIEGSTRLLLELGAEEYRRVQDDHSRILRDAVAAGEGREVRTEGDSFFVVFSSARGAVRTAVTAQRALADHPWTHGEPLRVRMGIHTGEGRAGGDDYIGIDVNRAARIAAAGHGGQVLVSETTTALLSEALPPGTSLRDLGEHRFKDFDQPQRVHQLEIEGLPSDFPALKTLDVPTNLPLTLTSFVGREGELVELGSLLDRARLVTLVGPGGTGKTRLALEAAARRVQHHRDGVFFVDLSSIRDPDLVPFSVAKVLGAKELPGRPALDTVTAHLADRRSLLLLDNFEQVVGAAHAVSEVLRAAPNVQVVATSRIRLGLAGEQEYPVPPLRVPAANDDLRRLAANEAVALFTERARAVRPAFELTEANGSAVAEICARLDGLPLAIELAAAQLRVLSPHELLARLEHRLPLRTGAGNVPERQRTLRDTIEWSYELLDARQRALFARLAVFAGGATLTAIEAVCNPEVDLGVDTLDAVTSLVDHSLVRRDDEAQGSRFAMLDTIREYAAERLAGDDDIGETERQHAEFFVAMAQEWGPHVRSSQAPTATAILERDYDNIRAAVAWAHRADRADIGLRAAAPMWMFWVEHGPVHDGRRAVDALLSLRSAAPRDSIRRAALEALGSLSYWEGDYGPSEQAYGEALQLSRELGEARGMAEAFKNLAYVAGATGDPERALSLAEAARTAAREAGDVALAAEAAGLVGLSLSREGDHEGALAATQEALEGFEAEGISYWANQMRSRLGSIYLRMEDLDRAEALLRTSLADMPGALSSAIGRAANASMLAAVAGARGDHDRALRLTGYTEAVAERMGSSPPAALLGESAAFVEASRAALDRETVERLLAEGRAMGDEEAVAYALGQDP
jgi:predicted ATPase/class 3 adenylate cyclase